MVDIDDDTREQLQQGGLSQAVLFHARERRRSLAGIVEMFRTHRIYGGTAMAVANIDVANRFPVRTRPTTFVTAIRITAGSVAGQHRGLIFEMGAATRGAALWIGDQTIGVHFGDAGTVNGVTALFDRGAEWPIGLEMELVAAIRPGTGRARLWANGREIARAQASAGTLNTLQWSSNGGGSFAAAKQVAVVSDVPAASDKAPDGFQVIEPLSVYIGQVPRHFF